MTPLGSYPLNPINMSAYGSGNAMPFGIDDRGMVVGSSDLWSDDGQQGKGSRAVTFGILVLLLILRPQGIAGKSA